MIGKLFGDRAQPNETTGLTPVPQWQKPLPLLFSGLIFLTCLLIWQSTRLLEQDHLRTKIKLATETVKYETQEWLFSRVVALQQLIGPGETLRIFPPNYWQLSAHNYMKFYPNCQALQWIDASGLIRGSVTQPGVQAPGMTGHKTFLESKANSGRKMMIKPAVSPQDNPEIWVYIPLFNQQKFDGFLFASFRTDSLLKNQVSSLDIVPEYGIEIWVNQVLIYQRELEKDQDSQQWIQEISFMIEDTPVNAKIWPEPHFLAQEESFLSEIVLGGGCLITLSLGVAFSTAQRAKVRAKDLRILNKALNEEIRDRKQTELKLQESYNLLHSVLESTPDLVYVKDLEGRYVIINSAFANFVNLSNDKIIQKKASDIFPQETAQSIRNNDLRISQEGRAETVEELIPVQGNYHTYLTTKNPWYDARGNVIGLMGMARDISDRKESEEALRQSEQTLRQKTQELENTLRKLQQTQAQLIHSEKMSSLGQTVAGVAHEINNPVNFIYGNLTYVNDYTQDLLDLIQVYQEEYPQPSLRIIEKSEAIELDYLIDDLPKILASMKVGADRIRDIVLTLRNFSRLDEADLKEVDIHQGLESTLLILQNRLNLQGNRPGIEVIKKYGDIPLVECYPGQLNQVYINLLANAIDALESQGKIEDKPTIVIETEMHNKDQVKIQIRDNGIGMTEEVRKRLFDPFFTTKPIGKGTGLGLAISHAIVVDKHGGKLVCDSASGEGAVFRITIPICQNEKSRIVN